MSWVARIEEVPIRELNYLDIKTWRKEIKTIN